MRLGFYTLAVSERDDNGNPDEMKVVFFNSLSLHDDVHRGGSSDGSGRSGYGMSATQTVRRYLFKFFFFE